MKKLDEKEIVARHLRQREKARERQAKARQKRQEKGEVQVVLWVPKTDLEEAKAAGLHPVQLVYAAAGQTAAGWVVWEKNGGLATAAGRYFPAPKPEENAGS